MKIKNISLISAFFACFYGCQSQNNPIPTKGVLSQISSENTFALLGIEALQDLPKIAERLLGQSFTPFAQAVLGQDWNQKEIFATYGLDPQSEWALFLDVRMDGPCIIGQIKDRPLFEKALQKQGIPPIQKLDGGLEQIDFKDQNQSWLIGQRAPYTIACQASPEPLYHSRFQAILDDHSPSVAQDENFLKSFKNRSDKGSYAYLNLSIMPSGLRPGNNDISPEDILFYARKFPALSATIGLKSDEIALHYDQTAYEGLKKIFVPRAAAPHFERYLDRDSVFVMRFGINLEEIVMGVKDFVPPSLLSKAAMLDMIDAFLPMLTGVSRLDFAAALSGHFVIAASSLTLPQSEEEAPALFLAGVQNREACEKLFERLTAAKQVSGVEKEDFILNNQKALHISLKGHHFYLAIDQDVLVVAMSRSKLERTIQKRGTLPADWEKALSSPATFVLITANQHKPSIIRGIFHPQFAQLTSEGASPIESLLQATISQMPSFLQSPVSGTLSPNPQSDQPASSPDENR